MDRSMQRLPVILTRRCEVLIPYLTPLERRGDLPLQVMQESAGAHSAWTAHYI